MIIFYIITSLYEKSSSNVFPNARVILDRFIKLFHSMGIRSVIWFHPLNVTNTYSRQIIPLGWSTESISRLSRPEPHSLLICLYTCSIPIHYNSSNSTSVGSGQNCLISGVVELEELTKIRKTMFGVNRDRRRVSN